MALAPESREGFWDLGGDPHAHPPRGKAGSGPSDSGGHFDPKIFAQLLQEDKGENGVRNEPDSSRNKALRQQEGEESVCACHWSSQQPKPGSSTGGQAWVSPGWAVGQALSHHGHHGAHRSQHHVPTPLAPALLCGSLMGAAGPQLWAQPEPH